MRPTIVARIIASTLCLGAVAHAEAPGSSVVVPVHSVDAQGVGASIGTIEIRDSAGGLELIPNLTGLTPGEHGFHIHENPNCGPKEKDGKMTAAMAAGGHFDPHATGKHLGPHGGGHEGDLPKLEVGADGTATKVLSVPGLHLAEIRNRSLMIHAGGDNYADAPAPLGGGGARVACGVIPQ
jgi:Cu-Zn family superoxide dismutase